MPRTYVLLKPSGREAQACARVKAARNWASSVMDCCEKISAR
jgi:hypothetical protein